MGGKRLLFITALAGAAAVAGFFVFRKEKGPAGPAPIDIYFTCDTSGRLEPCGCFTGHNGGLTRVSTVLAKKPTEALKVEIGNAIAGSADYQVIQYRYLLEAYAAMGYAAVNVGAREAKLSAETLRELAKNAKVPLISANVVDAKTGAPVAATHHIATKAGVRIGIVGVVDPTRIEGGPEQTLRVGAMDEAIRTLLPQLQKDADVLVCLAFTDEAGMSKLARDFYELDFILGGDVPQPSKSALKVNQSHLLATTNQARALGELHATFNFTSKQPEDVTGDITLMVDTIRQEPALIALSAKYRKLIRDTPLAVDAPGGEGADRIPGVHSGATYVGSQACAACHPKAFAIWEKTGHAHAFEPLKRKDSDADPNCISCHTIGFGEPSGYTRSMQGAQLIHVGCESCHGPASEHIRLRAAALASKEAVGYKMRAVGAGTCIQCHHGEFSRPFKWEQFWPVMQHGKE